MAKKDIKQENYNKLLLKELLKNVNYDTEFDFETFSSNIKLNDYQIAALKNAFNTIILYQVDYKELDAFYKNKKIDIGDNINRASFWMATGSGKTIVMIKLIVVLDFLYSNLIINKKPIMLIAPNENILNQFKEHISYYNNYNSSKNIIIKDIKEFEDVNNNAYLFNNIVVYFMRMDLLDEEENVGKAKNAKRVNYKNFFTKNGWYILLDEAHKGDNKDSIRKKYINELAKGINADNCPLGFIFNFSATFTDDIDLYTCAFNYNLERFNNDGYGKNIAVLNDNLNFKIEANDKEKKIRILESFIIFNAIKKSKEKLFKEFKKNYNEELYYHEPLMITVSDKVNTEDAGIKLYFEAVLDILKNDIDITKISENLYHKLKEQMIYFDKNKNLGENFLFFIKNTDSKSIRVSVFHSNEISMCEACKITGNDKELAFKSKNSNKPFLLLNIGDAKSKWTKEYIQKLNIELGEDLQNSYFNNINSYDSPINIMMGSKVFTEGWDSNRVNLISFINIGSAGAKKYVLQTIGRGVRIEPFKNNRKRLEKYNFTDYNSKEELIDLASGLETLFVMATNNKAIESILDGMERFITDRYQILKLKKTNTFSPLLIPKYKDSDNLVKKDYVITIADYYNLTKYIESYDEDVLLLTRNLKSNDFGYSSIQKIKNKTNIKIIETHEYNIDSYDALPAIDSFFNTKQKECTALKILEDEISHYEKIYGTNESIVKSINEQLKIIFSNKINQTVDELKEDFQNGKISIDEYTQKIQDKSNNIIIDNYQLDTELEKHYYIPMIIDNKNTNNINYVIKEKSEIIFLNDLKEYLKSKDNALNNYEWCFSFLIENTDNIYIPYFDDNTQSMRKFFPDFIFWLKSKKDNNYKIIFVDPKGLTHEANPKFKARGFENIFKNSPLKYDNHIVEIQLVYYNKYNIDDIELNKYIKHSCKEIFIN